MESKQTVENERHLVQDHVVDEAGVVGLETVDHELDHLHVQVGQAGVGHVEQQHDRILRVEQVGLLEKVRQTLEDVLLREHVFPVELDDKVEQRLTVDVLVAHEADAPLEQVLRKWQRARCEQILRVNRFH
jgi:hypothetical protein